MGDNPDRKHRPSRIAGGWAWSWLSHPGKDTCHEIWRSNSRILQLAEASEEGQGPRRAVEPVMMMMNGGDENTTAMLWYMIKLLLASWVTTSFSVTTLLHGFSYNNVPVGDVPQYIPIGRNEVHRKCKESVCMVQLEDPISQPRPELSSIWRSVVWDEIERIQEHGIWIQHTGVFLRSSSSCNSILSPLAPKGLNIILPLPLSSWHIVRLNLILCFKELGQTCHPVADNVDFSLTAIQLIYLLAS
jgi:hypothetical protein